MRPIGNVIFVGPLINGPDKKLGLVHRDYRIVGEMWWGNPVTNHKLPNSKILAFGQTFKNPAVPNKVRTRHQSTHCLATFGFGLHSHTKKIS
jgi:hypothetical protein